MPLDAVSAVDLLADGLADLPEDAVVVAPDLGAVKLAERYAARLGLRAAFVGKARLSGREVEARTLVGQVRGRVPVVIDDTPDRSLPLQVRSVAPLLAAAIRRLIEERPSAELAAHG